MIEVAVIASAPRSKPVLAAIKRYQEWQIPSHFDQSAQQLPFGGDIGKWFTYGFDHTSSLLGFEYFYIAENQAVDITVCHQKPMQTWTNTMDEAFAAMFKEEKKWDEVLDLINYALR